MQNLESIDWSNCVKFYVGAHFSTLFYTLSTIINVFTQIGHEADEFAGLKVRCERRTEFRELFITLCDSSSGTKADHRQVSVTVAASTSVAPTGKASGGVSRGIITSLSPINRL
jgi:hypothetical protein